MHFSATVLALLAAVATQATSVVSQSSSNWTFLGAMSVPQAAIFELTSPLPLLQHNQYGHNGWIQDKAGTDIWLGNGKSVTVAGGWGFFWIDSNVCADNAATFGWPENYGDVYIKGDGFLHDSNGKNLDTVLPH